MSTLTESASELVRSFVPSWKVIPKSRSKLHSTIEKILPFANYEEFFTTVGYTCAVPEGEEDNWWSIFHEGVHAQQARKITPVVFIALYLLPQILAVPFFLLALVFWNPWFLLGLLFLLPIPAYFRMKFELEAYIVSVIVMTWMETPERSLEFIDWVVCSHFAGPNYYFMWPFKDSVRASLMHARRIAILWGSGQDVITKKDLHLRFDPYLNSIRFFFEKRVWS